MPEQTNSVPVLQYLKKMVIAMTAFLVCKFIYLCVISFLQSSSHLFVCSFVVLLSDFPSVVQTLLIISLPFRCHFVTLFNWKRLNKIHFPFKHDPMIFQLKPIHVYLSIVIVLYSSCEKIIQNFTSSN